MKISHVTRDDRTSEPDEPVNEVAERPGFVSGPLPGYRRKPRLGELPSPAWWQSGTVVAAAAVLVVAGLVGGGWLVWDTLRPVKAGSPTQAVNMYYDAWFENDIGTLLDLTCDKEAKDGRVRGPADGMRRDQFQVNESEAASGSEAWVSVTVVVEGRSSSFHQAVVKEDGGWKLCDSDE